MAALHAFVSALIAAILSLLPGTHTALSYQAAANVAAADTAVPSQTTQLPADPFDPSPASSPPEEEAATTTVVEKVIEQDPLASDDLSDYVTQEELDAQLNDLSSSLLAKFNARSPSTSSIPEYVAADGNPENPFAALSAINNLSNVTISGAHISGGNVTATAFSGTMPVGSGGTGISNAPAYGELLLGNGSGYTFAATSSLGFPQFSDLSSQIAAAYEFPGDATSTMLTFAGGLLSTASTTLGNGNQNGGLTVSGGATTTGAAYFGGATTTAADGFDITSGCFAVDGTCITSGAGGRSNVSTSSANTWSALQLFAAAASTTNLSVFDNAYFGGSATSSFNASGQLTLAGIGNYSLLSTDGGGTVVATTSIGTNLLTGTLGTINGQTLAAGGPVTVTAASSTLLADNNTFGGSNTFTQTVSGSVSGNAGTVTNGVYTTTFGTLFDNHLAATTSLPNIATLAGLSLPYSQLTGVPAFDTFAYPFSGNATSTTLDFNGGLQVASLSGFVGGNSGTLYQIASSSLDLPNSALQNSSITVNGTNISFGGSSTITAASSSLLGDDNTWTGLQNFANASTTFGTTWLSGVTASSLLATNAQGQVSATTSIGANLLTGVLGVGDGGTGLNSTPSYGQLLLGNGSGYTFAATSSLGISIPGVANGPGIATANNSWAIFSGSSYPGALAFDSSGNLYVADEDSGVFKVTPSGSVSTFATVGSTPDALAFDSSGNLYVANYSSDTVSKVTPSGSVSTFATVGSGPDALAFDSSGNLYVANQGSGTVSKVTPGGIVSTFATVGSDPVALAFDSSGNLYVANEVSSGSVSKVTPGGAVTTFATGSYPHSLVFDSSGNLYVANYGSATVSEVTPGGSASTFATVGTEPVALAFDSSGNLYVANQGSGTVSKVTPGGIVSTFATVGSDPRALAFDSSGNLYVMNQGSGSNGSVSKVTLVSNVGIGTTSPNLLLTVGSSAISGAVADFINSTGSCSINPTTTSLSCSSDERLKDNINSISTSTALADILELDPVYYNWTSEATGTPQHAGFIAQAVQPVFPDLVSTDTNGYLQLNYAGFVPYIVAAVQNLANEVAGFAQSITTEAITAATGSFGQINTGALCITDGPNDSSPVCVTKAQLAALLSAAGTQDSTESVTSQDDSNSSPGGSISVTSTTTDSGATDTPPVIQINGNNPAIVQVGAVYTDLGATITGPEQDLNLGIETFVNGVEMSPVLIDTSAEATDTIDYVVTDQNDLTATSTRTVIIEAANDNIPVPANDNEATTTSASSTGN